MSRFIKDSERLGRKPCFVTILLLVVGLTFLTPVSYSITKGTPLRVIKVAVSIDGRPSEGTVDELITLKPGDSFSLKEINDSIKRIYRTELFSDISVVRSGEENVEITFHLTSRLYTRHIRFSGSVEVSQNQLKSRLSALAEGSAFSEVKLERALEELQQQLREDGYFNTPITPLVTKVPDSSEVDILFDVGLSQRFIVGNLEIIGDTKLPEDRLRKEMQTEKGQIFIPSQLEQDIAKLKELYASEDFRRAEIAIKERTFDFDSGLVNLILEVIPREKITIVIQGADVPLSLLRPIWEANIFEEWGLSEGEAKIVGYLRQRGYLFVTVDSRFESSANEFRVIYAVTPGDKYRIRDMTFEGLSYFSPDEIKDELLIRTNFLLLSKIDGARLFELPREIEFLYKTRGFPDTRVDLIFEKTGKRVRPIFYVEEGIQQTINTISFDGTEAFGKDVLLQQIGASEGGFFFQPDIQRDLERLTNFYMNNAFRGTEIVAQIQEADENRFDLYFSVVEGEKVAIERIIVTGHKATKTSTILREVQVSENGLARYDDIRETERRLANLGIFSEVRIEEIPLSPQRVNLLISVREGSRNYASFGIGLETKSDPQTFSVWNNEIRPRGTAEFTRNNILGIAAQFSIFGQISTREKRLVFSWEQPYFFFNFPLATYVNAWIEAEERKSFSYDRRGVHLGVIKLVSSEKNMNLLTTLGYEKTILTDLFVLESKIDRQYFPYSKTSIAESFIMDRRNDPFNVERGYFLSAALEWAYPLFNAESDFLKLFTKYQHYVPVFPDWTFSGTFRFGLGRGRMPIHERFFAGGSNSFRGTRFDELGPKDPVSQQPTGGKALLLFNFEMTFPLLSAFKDLYGAVFYDVGNVWALRRDVDLSSLQNALGLGLRYRTPLGPIRLEVAWYVDAAQGENEILGFITIGNVF
ncbi:MAG: POTRA domain-containing protein [Candidatus Aminicenantes bacterium]|jgi:outer membrane protein insertion porin family